MIFPNDDVNSSFRSRSSMVPITLPRITKSLTMTHDESEEILPKLKSRLSSKMTWEKMMKRKERPPVATIHDEERMRLDLFLNDDDDDDDDDDHSHQISYQIGKK